MLKLLKKLFTSKTEQQRIEKYLAQSVDIYDLEARMRSLQEAERTKQSFMGYRKY